VSIWRKRARVEESQPQRFYPRCLFDDDPFPRIKPCGGYGKHGVLTPQQSSFVHPMNFFSNGLNLFTTAGINRTISAVAT
jgi:hypothetical protein